MSETRDSVRSAGSARLRALTPARVGLGRTGVSQQTRDLLDFQRATRRLATRCTRGLKLRRWRARSLREIRRSRDSAPALRRADRTTYLADGRTWAASSTRPSRATAARGACAGRIGLGLALIVADGLSALAVERHVPPLLRELLPRLEGWRLAPICVVEQGRVAIGDEIGAALGAQICRGAHRRAPGPQFARLAGRLHYLATAAGPHRRRAQLHLQHSRGGTELCPGRRPTGLLPHRGAPSRTYRHCAEGRVPPD